MIYNILPELEPLPYVLYSFMVFYEYASSLSWDSVDVEKIKY